MQDQDIQFRFMNADDIEQIVDVEKASFPTPWTKEAFQNELFSNHFAYYMVAVTEGRVVGYCGVWLIVDEAHITNIAVHPLYRGRKIGVQLMGMVMQFAFDQGARRMTLEVRVSNKKAQRMYERFGFEYGGVRRAYYTDNREDAYIMWADLKAPPFLSEAGDHDEAQ
jgi:[ribosomal protein S18]-alanine N-acetyltransferase